MTAVSNCNRLHIPLEGQIKGKHKCGACKLDIFFIDECEVYGVLQKRAFLSPNGEALLLIW